MLATTLLTVLSLVTPPAAVRVCKNTACKKSGSQDTLDALFHLASASKQATDAAAENTAVACATTQAAFAARCVEASGCLGKCGSGPNCCTTTSDILYHDVYKPASCVALLDVVGVDVPEPAQKAWLRRMYAMRALRSNKPGEAAALLTEALNEASVLRANAAHLIQSLLELRADAHEVSGERDKAAADRERAVGMRGLTAESLVRRVPEPV